MTAHDTDTTTSTIGERFARALAAGDAATLNEVLDERVELRALTPGRAWEASSRREVLDVLGQWFEPEDRIEALDHLECVRVVDRERITYRLLVRNAAGLHLVEQHAYVDTTGDAITGLQMICSGYRPLPS